MSLYLGNNLISGAEQFVGESRNIGQIIESVIPLTDAGLHLLDGTRLSGDGIYKGFVDYVAELYNDTKVYNPSAFTVVGSPNITDDGVASGFSNSNYITPSLASSIIGSNIIEIISPVFNINSLTASQQYLWMSSSTSGILSFIAYINTDGTARFRVLEYINTRADSNNINIATNTNYRVKYSITPSSVSIYLSTNNGPWTSIASGTNVNSAMTISNNIKLGRYYGNTPQLPLTNGTLDLKEFSITVDGVEVFNGSTPAKYFTDETSWQASISQYGVCGKFVYDSVNNTVRLPKITGIIEGTTDASALGDLVEAGLPNITSGTDWLNSTGGTLTNAINTTPSLDGCFDGASTGGHGISSNNYSIYWSRIDASRSSSIYGNSNTVQPQTIKVLYYIVIATSTKTDIQVDIDEIATDLNGKADVDLSNTTPAVSFATALNNAGIRTVVETYINGTSWYRVYSDGWCEQGGITAVSTSLATVNFLKTFIDTNYTINLADSYVGDSGGGASSTGDVSSKTISSIQISQVNHGIKSTYWEAKGYIN